MGSEPPDLNRTPAPSPPPATPSGAPEGTPPPTQQPPSQQPPSQQPPPQQPPPQQPVQSPPSSSPPTSQPPQPQTPTPQAPAPQQAPTPPQPQTPPTPGGSETAAGTDPGSRVGSPADLFVGLTVIVADDPEGWSRALAERVDARVVTAPFEAEQILAQRAGAMRAKQLRDQAEEARRLLSGVSTTGSAPPGPDQGAERVRRLAEGLGGARGQEQAARNRLADAEREAQSSDWAKASLQSGPDELRRAAEAAAQLRSTACALQEALGPRPLIDPQAEHDVTEARDEFEDSTEHREFLRRRLPPIVAIALGVALLVVAARQPLLITAGVVLVLAAGVAFLISRVQLAGKRARVAKRRYDRILRETGIERVEDLESRRADLETWQQRASQVTAATDAEADARATWYRLAGAEVPPDRVEQLLADQQRVRQVSETVSAARGTHAAASAEVARLEEEWRRLMGELGIDAPPSDPSAALTALAARPPTAPAMSDVDARARAQEILRGRTVGQLLEEAARLEQETRTHDERPIVLADPLRTLPADRKRSLLFEFERLSALTPVLLVTADPETQEWAASRSGNATSSIHVAG